MLSVLFIATASVVVVHAGWGASLVPVLVLAALGSCRVCAQVYRETLDEQTGRYRSLDTPTATCGATIP